MENEIKDLKNLHDFINLINESLNDEEYLQASFLTGALGQQIQTLIVLKEVGLNYNGCQNKKTHKENASDSQR